MQTISDTFGPLADPDLMAEAALASPHTDAGPAHASTERATLTPAGGFRGMLDPQGSAMFWFAAAAILGLGLVTGQLKVSASVRGGR